MRRLPPLSRLAITVWLEWLILLGLLYAMLNWHVWHAQFLPIMAVLLFLLVTGSWHICAAVWRLVRGPERCRALTCLLVGSAPLWFLTGHLMYGLDVGSGRQVPFNLP